MMDTLDLAIRENLILRVNCFPSRTEKKPVVFLPGWVTIIKNYMPIITLLQEQGHSVYYLETREKITSKFSYKPRSSDFSIELNAEDLELVIGKLGFSDQQFHCIGTSYGALILLEYLRNNPAIQPDKKILLIPALDIRFKGWTRLILYLPLFLRPLIIKLVEFKMKQSFYNKDEPETAYKFSEKIYDIDFYKTKQFSKYLQKVDGLQLIKYKDIANEIMFIGAENDLMHPENEMRTVASSFQNAVYLNLISNKYTHSRYFGEIAVRYFENQSYDDIINEIYSLENRDLDT